MLWSLALMISSFGAVHGDDQDALRRRAFKQQFGSPKGVLETEHGSVSSWREYRRYTASTRLSDQRDRSHPKFDQQKTSSKDSASDPQIRSRALAILCFPLNAIPNVMVVTLRALKPGNLWPLQYAILPIAAPVVGLQRAWQGYSFWNVRRMRY